MDRDSYAILRRESVSAYRDTVKAIFNRVDDDPGTTHRHSKHPPLPPLRMGGKRPDAADFPPLAKGG